ncbi:MAG TPA: GNAT family N-acetyltransferase [Acidimicrobiia bacterium]|nr:GNAT family N-acetyltransferase [Acidimicrobiia bacterium]
MPQPRDGIVHPAGSSTTSGSGWPAENCPACGSDALEGAAWDRLVCRRCGSCWEDARDDVRQVDSIACPGCDLRTVCESRPTWLANSMTHAHRLRDGTEVVVRPLLYSDRDEIARGFDDLSPADRRLRFLSPPRRLTDEQLEYLTNLDYDAHFALAAFPADEPGPGIGVARYVRDPDHPEQAEVAVTVIAPYRGRGVGTLLLGVLVDEALRRGVRTCVAHVLWDNETILEPLQSLGARIASEGSGVARVEVDLPTLRRPTDRRPRGHKVGPNSSTGAPSPGR